MLHVLHATADLAQAIDAVSELLVPGGYVFAMYFDGAAWETRGFQEWFDFGKDRDRHCAVSLSKWRELLNGSGFSCDTFSTTHPDEDHSPFFLAQKSGERSLVNAPSDYPILSDCAAENTVCQASPGYLTKENSRDLQMNYKANNCLNIAKD